MLLVWLLGGHPRISLRDFLRLAKSSIQLSIYFPLIQFSIIKRTDRNIMESYRWEFISTKNSSKVWERDSLPQCHPELVSGSEFSFSLYFWLQKYQNSRAVKVALKLSHSFVGWFHPLLNLAFGGWGIPLTTHSTIFKRACFNARIIK